jgi:uncharacterized protein
MMANYRKMASPSPDPESKPFWDAAREGRFLVRGCNSCGKVHWFPRTICPICGSSDTEWKEGSGRGKIYTFTEMHRAKEQYILAYVELEEGPRALTNIVDCAFGEAQIGQDVEVVFVPTAEGAPPVPCFRPVKQ